MKLIYKSEPKNGVFQLFGKNFVINNKFKCIIIYKNKKFLILVYLKVPNIVGNNKLEIILVELEDITNRSYMFQNCHLLEKIYILENNKNELIKDNITKEKNIDFFGERIYNNFYSNCKESLKITNNINESSNTLSIFEGYSSLSFIPDLSKWNTYICCDLSHMFNGALL